MPKDEMGLEINQYRKRIFGFGGCARVYDSWCEDCLACRSYHNCLRGVLLIGFSRMFLNGRTIEKKGLPEKKVNEILIKLGEGEVGI